MILDDFFVIFRVVKHSKKILADNQLFTGLRDGSPGLSLGIPHPPYGALLKIAWWKSAICRANVRQLAYMRGRIPATDWFRPYHSWNYDICYSSTNERCYHCDRCRFGVAAVAALYFVGGWFNIINANSLECQRYPAKAEKCQKNAIFMCDVKTYISTS